MVYRVGTGESSSQTKAKQNVVQTVATFALSSEPSKRDSDFAPDPDRDPDPVQTGTPQQTPKNLCHTQLFSLGIVITQGIDKLRVFWLSYAVCSKQFNRSISFYIIVQIQLVNQTIVIILY